MVATTAPCATNMHGKVPPSHITIPIFVAAIPTTYVGMVI